MSNYLRAEWYKLRCRKYLWITALIVLAAETLMFAAYGILHASRAGMDFHTGWTNLLPLLGLGFFMPLLTGDMVFADQYKNGTLKNELSFGLSRGMIYWGKLLAQTVLSLALCALFVGYYFAGCWLLLPHDPALDAQALELVGRCLATALPLWLGTQALVCCMYFLFRSDLMGAAAAIVLQGGLPVVYLIFGGLGQGTVLGDGADRLYRLLPTVLLDRVLNTAAGWDLCALAWGVGAAWFALFTAIGLLVFSRKEL